jgi:uncharacterized protein
MLYIVLAHDGTDPEAPARRQRVRATHLEGIRPAVDSGMLQLGGAILDDAGTMIGSALLVEAASADAARDFIDNDIYSREGVWRRVEIYPFQRAI